MTTTLNRYIGRASTGLDQVRRGSNLRSILDDVGTAFARVALYTRGTVPSEATKIGEWVASGGLLYPVKAERPDQSEGIRTDLVTDSQYGIQDGASPTTGLTRTLVTGHNMPAAGFVTVWDVSAALEIATTAAFAVAGDTITFTSDPGTTATGDLFHVEGLCEFGELRERANGGLWVPLAGGTCLWAGGLEARVKPVRLVFAQLRATNIHPKTRFVADVARTLSTLNDVVGGGVLHDSDARANGVGWHYNGVNWGRTVLRNGIGAAWIYNHGTDAGTPGNPTSDVEFNLSIFRQSATATAVVEGDVSYAGETVGSAVSVSDVLFLVGGPSGDSLLICESPGDDIRITLKEITL